MQSSRDTIIEFSPEGTAEEQAGLLGNASQQATDQTAQNDTILELGNEPEENNEAAQDLLGEDGSAPGCLTRVKMVVVNGGIYILAGIAASPSALNALAAPSGLGPEHIGAEWWNNMSTARQIYSVASGGSSFAVNTIMNALFIPVSIDKVKNGLTEMRNGCASVVSNTSALGLGVGSAVAAGAIAYGSFLWLPVSALASIPTVIAFVITFASRYIGIRNIYNRIGNLFNADVRLQKAFADKLEHIDETQIDAVNAKLQNIIAELFPGRDNTKPLTEEEWQLVIAELATKLETIEGLQINDATVTETIANAAGTIFDITVSIAIMTPAFMTFTQKGFDGVNILSKFAGQPLDDIHVTAKAAIGFVPGLASGMSYASGGMDFRNTMTSVIKHLFQNPTSLLPAIGLFAANGVASNSMSNVGQGVINKPNNIFALANNTYGTIYLALLTIGGAMFNMNSSFAKAFLGSSATAAQDLKVLDVAKRLRADDKPISSQTASVLSQSSVLAQPPQREQQNTYVQDEDTSNDFVFNV